MATGSLDRTICVYDTRDGYCLGTLEGHKVGNFHKVQNF